MRLRKLLLLCFALLILTPLYSSHAQYSAVVMPPVDHPVTVKRGSLNTHRFTQGTGDWGETLVNAKYRARGYEVMSIKSTGGQGIDHLAIKRDLNGRLVSVKFGETKTGRSKVMGPAKTKLGPQLSRDWLAHKLRSMRNSGDPSMRKLARDISVYRKSLGVPVESFGEFYEVNTRSGRLIQRNPTTDAVVRNASLWQELIDIKHRDVSSQYRSWAKKSLRGRNKISSIRMREALNPSYFQKQRLLSGARTPSSLSRIARGAARPALLRAAPLAAGVAGVLVVVAWDGYEVYSAFSKYHAGDMSKRDVTILIVSRAGGIVTSVIGMKVGAAAGLLGGPFVFVTVPAGAFVGGAIGYWAGSAALEYALQGWYSGLDDDVLRATASWMMSTPSPSIIK